MAIVNDKIAVGLRDVLDHFGDIPTGEFVGSEFHTRPDRDAHYADAFRYALDGSKLVSGSLEARSATRDDLPDASTPVETNEGARHEVLNEIAAQIQLVHTLREMEAEGFGAW